MENVDDIIELNENAEPTQQECVLAILKGWQQAHKFYATMLLNSDVALKTTIVMLWVNGRMNNIAAVDTMLTSTMATIFTYIFRKKIFGLFAKHYVRTSEIIPRIQEIIKNGQKKWVQEILKKYPALMPALIQASESIPNFSESQLPQQDLSEWPPPKVLP